MMKNFETIIAEYQKQVDKFNKKNEQVESTISDCLNMISIQNDTIIRLLIDERLGREFEDKNEYGG